MLRFHSIEFLICKDYKGHNADDDRLIDNNRRLHWHLHVLTKRTKKEIVDP